MDNNYSNWARQDLIDHIHMLEKKFQGDNERFIVNFPWAGNLGQWVWYYEKNLVHFNDRKISQLGYNPEMIGHVGFEFFTNKLHPDDYERVMDNMKKHLMGITPVYEVEYRIQHRDGHYIWYYDRGTVTKRTADGRPILLEGIVFDITESKQIESRLLRLAQRDPLTGVFNRHMLFIELNHNIERYIDEGTPFSIIMFDIDHFKEVNDRFGHLVGDDVLIQVTQIVNEDKRSKDRIFRYGGDEFFILLPKTGIEGARKVATRLQDIIATTTFPKVNHISVSMGVAEYHKESDDEFLNIVDQRLYEAKHQGRNQVRG